MAKDKLDRLSKMSGAVESADLKTKEIKDTTSKAETIRKHITIPKEWSELIKNNYGGTANSYIVSALRKQLERDGYI